MQTVYRKQTRTSFQTELDEDILFPTNTPAALPNFQGSGFRSSGLPDTLFVRNIHTEVHLLNSRKCRPQRNATHDLNAR